MERLKAIALDRDNPKHPIYEAVLLYLSICKIELKYINDLFTTKIRDYELGNFNDYKQRELEHLESSNTPTPKASEPLKQLCYPLEKRAHKRVINAGSKERRKERTEKYINKILKMENNRARPRAEAEPQSREPQLPTELDNDGAKEIFAKAVEVGLMEIQGNGYKWNRSKVLLAYMLNKIYTGVFPATDLDKLFGVSGLKQAVYSLPNNKKPPKGYKEIDILFKEA